MVRKHPEVRSADGRLGVLLPGMGAVATTFIAGVEAIKAGLGKPIGSLTQMGTIRLGKRTDGTSPMIKDFVPLAGLEDLVFGGWDVFEDDVYAAASHAGVLEQKTLDALKEPLSKIKPMKAVFDKNYVKRLEGSHVKSAATKWELAEMAREDICSFKSDNGCDRLVMIWCGSTEIFLTPTPVHETIEIFEQGLKDNDERQSFDCPLLEGTRCLVHDVAKPIGCLAWHSPSPDADPSEYTFTPRGWNAFADRDELNDRFQGGSHWKLRVIPLWLKRVFSGPLERRRKKKHQRPRD